MFACFMGMLYFCSEKNKIVTMSNSFAYYYGFYFYFAGNCEAVGRK